MARSREEIKKSLASGVSRNSGTSRSREEIKRSLVTGTSDYSRMRDDITSTYNTAISSVGKAYGQYSTADELATYKNDVINANNSANMFAERYGKYLNPTERKSISDMQNWYGSILNGSDEYSGIDALGELYGRYQNADAYNKARAKQNWANNNKGLTYADVKARRKNATGDELAYLNEYGTLVGYDNLADYDAELADLDKNPLNSKGAQTLAKNSKVWSKVLGKDINVSKDDVNSVQNYTKALEQKRNIYEQDHRADKYADLANNLDYAELSQYNANKGDMLTTGLGGEYWSRRQANFVDKGFGGIYEAINNRGDFKTTDDFALYMEDAYSRINEGKYNNLDANSPLLYMATDQMTDDEKATFNYLYSKDKGEAYDYLKDMHTIWQRRKTDSQEQAIDEFAQKGFWANAALTAGRIVAQPFANATSALNIVGGIAGGEYNPYNDSAYLKNFTDKAEQSVGSAISDATGNPQWAENLGIDLPSFLYSTGLSTVDSLIGGKIFGPGYAVVMGTGAFQTTAKQMAEQGYSQEDIWVKAGIAGLAEVITEYISLEQLDKLFKGGDIDAPKKILFAALKQMGYEGSEEVASEVINHMADEFYNGGASEMQNKIKAYMEQGYSKEEAEKKAYSEFGVQIAESFVGGALSGFAMGGGAAAGQYAQNSDRGATLRANGNLQSIDEVARGIEQDSDARRYYDSIVNDGTISHATNAQIANAYDKLALQLMTERNGSVLMDIENTLVENGFDRETEAKQTAKAIADFIANDNSVEGLSKDTIKILSQDKVLEFINKLVNDEVQINFEQSIDNNIKMSTLERANEKNLDIRNITEVSENDGVYTITNADGTTETIKPSDVDREQKRFLRYASEYKGDLNKLFIEGRNSRYSADDYATAFDMAYRGGLEGNIETVYSQGAVAQILGEENAMKVYQIGYNETIENAKATAQSVEEFANNLKAENIIKGKFETDVDYTKLSSRKKVAYKIAQALSAMGINVEVFDDAKATSKNGEFVPGRTRAEDKIRINLSARFYTVENGDSTGYVVDTMSHELTHWLEVNASDQYKVLANLVKEGLQSKGIWDERFQEEYNNAIRRGQDADEASRTAESEVVARACEDMLKDTSAMADILSRGTEEEVKGIKAAIIKFFKKFKSMIQKLLNGSKTYTAEAQALKQIDGMIDKMREAWTNAFDVAIANIQENAVRAERAEQETDIGIDEETGTVTSSMNSVKMTLAERWKALGFKSYEECIDEVAKDINEKANIGDLEKVKTWIRSEESIASLILKEENAPFLDYVADSRYDAIKKNSDYKQGTVDLSNLCRKREIFTRMFDNLQRQYPDVLFTADNIATIRQVLKEEHYEVACALCYVEDRRQKMGEIADLFIGFYKDALNSSSKAIYKVNSSGKRTGLYPSKGQIKRYGLSNAQYKATDNYIPTQYDLVTYEGFKKLTEKHPKIAYAFERYNASRGMQSARVIEGHAEYQREILGYSKAQVDRINDLGGLRVFSFSDFEAIHLIDIAQVITDCAKMGVKIQTYTKVPEFAALVRNTGIKLNRSLIPANVGSENAYARIIKDGKQKFVKVEPYENGVAKYKGQDVLAFDIVEGIDVTSKYFLDETDNANIGNILIGMSEKQIRLAMGDPFIDYIIPFHTGQSKSVLMAKGIHEWKNFKDVQLEKKMPGSASKMKEVNIYENVLKNGNITNAKEFVDAFLKVCEKEKLTPRFSEFLEGENSEGYYKLLLDFKMFDQNGNILPQEYVRPDIDTKLAKKILLEGKSREQSLQFSEDVMNKVKDRLNAEGMSLYSEKVDSKGNQLTADQEEFFKDSAVRDENGNLLVMHHGTPNSGFTIFDYGKQKFGLFGNGFYFTDNSDVAIGYSDFDNGKNPDVYRVYLNITNPLDMDAKASVSKWVKSIADTIGESEEYVRSFIDDASTNEDMFNVMKEILGDQEFEKYEAGDIAQEIIINMGYDGITHIGGGRYNKNDTTSHRVYIAYEQEQIKSVGNKKPTMNPDIRYSEKVDSDGKQLSVEQAEYFKNSKVVDKNGNLLKMYHGTKAQFTVFDRNMIGSSGAGSYEGAGFNFTPSEARASGYANGVVMGGYINIAHPLSSDSITIKARELAKVIATIDPTGDDLISNYARDTRDYGSEAFVRRESLVTAKAILEYAQNDVDVYSELSTGASGDARANLIQAFEDMGYDGLIHYYEDGSIKTAIAFNSNQFKNADNLTPTDNPDIRYSEKVTPTDYLNQGSRIESENQQFKADGNNLLTYISNITNKGEMTHVRNIELVADSILKKANSSYSKADLMTEIRNVINAITQASDDMGNFDVNWENIQASLEGIASDVLSKARDKSDIDPYYRRILKDYRAMRIAFSPDEANYARHTYGTAGKNFNDYRNAFMGKVILAQDGMSLNEAWDRLSKDMPDMFPSDATLEQKVDGLITGYEAIKNAAETVREYHNTESVRELAQTIYEKIWNVANKYADDNNQDVKNARAEHRKAMTDITKSRDEAIPNPTGTYLKIIKEIRDTNNQRMTDLKEQIERRKVLDRSRAEKQKVIRKIENNCDKLRTWLMSNDAKHHVVQPLQEPVRDLLFALDFSSRQSLGITRDGEQAKGRNSGRMTKRDVSLAQAMERVRTVVDETLKAQVDFSAMYDFPQDMLDIVDAALTAIRSLESVTDADMKSNNLQYNNALIINKLDISTLEYIDTIVSIMTKTVRNANNLLASRNAHSVDYIATDMMKDAMMKGERFVASSRGLGRLANGIDRFINFDNMTPYYFFKHIAGQRIFQEIMDGWDGYAFKLKDIVDFAEKTWTGKQVDDWSSHVHKFTVQERQTTEQELAGEEGNKVDIDITTAQLMSLYCLLKREQARSHIEGNGIKIGQFDNGNRTSGGRDTTLTLDEAYRMVNDLTQEQKDVADAIQHYMSTTCADWGNDISRKRFGIDAFTEENYFPIEVDNNALNKEAKPSQAQSIYRLLNMSFTKKLIENANNMIIINDIFDVFANHSTDMAKYNTLALPTLDLIKVLNYKEVHRTSGTQVQADTLRNALDTAYGKGRAVHYINQFLEDLNGSAVADDNQLSKILLRNAKIAAVGANFQVAALQPLSYTRAAYVLDPRYLARGLARRPQRVEVDGKRVWRHQVESGVSLWKSMGFYDVNANVGVSTLIKQNETVLDNIRQRSMIGAETMDNITWAALYNACEEWANDEVGASASDYRQKVNDKFREVCYATQVFDSTVSRSELMRSKHMGNQILTSFGSEPTLGFNMVYDAVAGFISDYRKSHNIGESLRKNRANILRAFGTFAVGAIVESALRAAIAKLRKPEDEETYAELLLSHFLDEINPLTKIPILKDIVSIAEGYSVSRLEYGGFENLTDAIRRFSKRANNGEFIFGDWKADFKMIQALSQLGGIPVSGVTKDAITLWNTLVRILGYNNLIVSI